MVELFKAPSSRLIYVFRINDSAHRGAVKIGEATYNGDLWPNQLTHDCKELRKAARTRINQYTQTAGIHYELVWATPAFSLEDGIKFNDKEIHQVLINSGFKKRQFNIDGKATEWIECDPTHVIKAIEAIKQGRKMLNSDEIEPAQKPIDFRDEQLRAIQMAVDIFRKGGKRALWNAKMRFGKTLSALDVVKRMQFKRTLILTHRPVVNASWFEDFNKIFFETAGRWIYGSKAASISFDYVEKFAKKAEPNSYVYFASMQDLRGSSKAGGKYDKNNELFANDWDCIIVDEAHEGTQTELGLAVLQELTKKKTKVLFLSGTPFNIQNEFTDEETFTWDYTMEQEAKRQWEIDHPGDFNPYGSLPTMNIYTYDLGRLLSQKQFADKEVAFNFREFFRTDNDGNLVHYDYVKKFLDLLTTEDKDSLYPFANKKFRSIFRHTLWMVPGVKEASALEEMLLNHENFGARGVKIVNVAGDMDVIEDDEERRYNNALTKLREAIGDNPFGTETITLSCGRLTTGVSVPEWTGVIMLSGTFNTAAAAYMQTIFRVQTPWEYGGLMKENCYVFDFAPDRTLTVLAEVARVNTKPGKADSEQKDRLAEFLNFCSVISEPGSKMRRIDANRLMERVKKVYIDRVVRSGFEDNGLYNDELLKLSDIDVDEFNRIGNAIGRTKAQKATNKVPVNQQGLDNEQYKKAEEAKKKKPKDRTPEDLAAIEEANKRKEMRRNAESVLRSISIRMPLLIYGADIDDSKQEITIDNFETIVDDASWNEFMPMCTYEETNAEGKKIIKRLPLSKAEFRKLKKYYDPDIFIAAAKRIRQLVRNADDMLPEQRIARIAEIFKTFRNPDKETVLTPWPVVNMHMTDTLGGYSFYNCDYSEPLNDPRYIDRDPITSDVFNIDSHLLEINSKTGLYPLWLTYNIYRSRIKSMTTSPETLEEHLAIWNETVEKNIFVVCKTKMARNITRRTLLGFRNGKFNSWVPDDLINKVRNQQDLFIKKVQDLVGNNVKIKAIVGNPPYQEVVAKKETANGQKTSVSIFQYFQLLADKLGQYSSLIYPGARWIHRSGKGMEQFGLAQINDPHLKLLKFFPNSNDVFKDVGIADGLSIVLKDAKKVTNGFTYIYSLNGVDIIVQAENPGEELFALNPSASQIVERLDNFISIHACMHESILPRSIFSIESDFVEKNPSLVREYNEGDYFDSTHEIKLFTNDKAGKAGRARWYIADRNVITTGLDQLDKWKVIVSSANAGGQKRSNQIAVIDNYSAFGRSRVALKTFDTEREAQNFLKYATSELIRFAFLLTDEALTSLAKKVPDIINYSDDNGIIDFDKDVDAQLYTLLQINEEDQIFIKQTLAEKAN